MGIPPQHCGIVFTAIPLGWAYYEANRLFYVSSPTVLAYLSGISQDCYDAADRISIIILTSNLLMTRACFFPACRNRHLSHSFEFTQFDYDRTTFIVPLPTGNSADLDSVCQYGFIRKASFDLFLSTLPLCRSLEIYYTSYANLDYPLLDYDFATVEISSLAPSRVARHQRLGYGDLVSVLGRDVVCWPDLAYASKKSGHADWSAADGKATNVSVVVECTSVDMPEMNDLAILLEKDTA